MPRNGRAATLIGAGAAAILCVLSAADREAGKSRSTPTILSILDFGSDHKRAQAIAALDDQNFTRAAKFAREAVWRDPLNDTLSVLGTALLGSNQPEAADAAYRVAGQMGWRDAGVQTYWLIQTLGTDNFDIAAQRLDALLRGHEPSDFATQALTMLESSAGGRAALVRRLAYSPDWAVWYLRSLRSSKPPTLERRSAILVAAAKAGLTLPLQQLGVVLQQLVNNGQYDIAREIGSAFAYGISRDADHGIVDGVFSAPVNSNTPVAFGWRYLQTGDVSVDQVRSAPGGLGSALEASSTATTARSIAQQILALRPGRHTLSWRAVDRSGSSTTILTVGLRCRDSQMMLVRPQRFGPAQMSVTFDIPSNGCGDQELRIVINPPPARATATAWISHLSVTDAA